MLSEPLLFSPGFQTAFDQHLYIANKLSLKVLFPAR